MPAISITIHGIENLLGNLDPNKAMGPDKISPYMHIKVLCSGAAEANI